MFGYGYGAHIASGLSNGRSVWQDIQAVTVMPIMTLITNNKKNTLI